MEVLLTTDIVVRAPRMDGAAQLRSFQQLDCLRHVPAKYRVCVRFLAPKWCTCCHALTGDCVDAAAPIDVSLGAMLSLQPL